MTIDPDGQFIWGAIIGGIIGAYGMGALANGSLNPAKWDWDNAGTWTSMISGATYGARLGSGIENQIALQSMYSRIPKTPYWMKAAMRAMPNPILPTEVSRLDPNIVNSPNGDAYMQAWQDLYRLDNASFNGKTFDALWECEELISMEDLQKTLDEMSRAAVLGTSDVTLSVTFAAGAKLGVVGEIGYANAINRFYWKVGVGAVDGISAVVTSSPGSPTLGSSLEFGASGGNGLFGATIAGGVNKAGMFLQPQVGGGIGVGSAIWFGYTYTGAMFW
jgi:hypothetical protein